MQKITKIQYLTLLMIALISIGCIKVYSQSIYNQSSDYIQSIAYIEESEQLNKQEVLNRFHDNIGVVLNNDTFNTGSRESHYWLLMTVKNNDSAISIIRLMTGVAYRVELNAYLFRSLDNTEKPMLILEENEQKPFTSRQNKNRFLNSKRFSLKAGETSRILISYRSRGSTFLPLSIETEQSFYNKTKADSVLSAVIYSFALTLGVFFLVVNLAMNYKTGIYYAGLFFLGLLFIAAIDGYAFKFLWPEWPRWNQYSSLVILLAINAAGFYTGTRVGNLVEKQPLFNIISLSLMTLNLIFVLLISNINFSILAFMANVLLFVMISFHLIAMSSWVSLKRNKITRLAMLVITLYIGVLAALFFISDKLPDEFIQYSNYISYLLLSVATMIAITAHMIGIRKDNEAALQAQLVAVKREAEINKSLFAAEQRYSNVREIARLRQQKLATATHDIRQPLISLRATMDSISQKQSPQIRQQLHDAFDYMEQLCNSYLEETRPENDSLLKPDDSNLETQKHKAEECAIEPYPVSLILSTTQQMFEAEAIAKGLEFKLVNSSFMTQKPPLVLMRIVSNLTANTIKHTSKGKVLIGCRRRGNKFRIEIHDTGKGISEGDISEIKQAYKKGKNSDGEGLGLAITEQLARQYGLKIVIESTKGKGSSFSIEI